MLALVLTGIFWDLINVNSLPTEIIKEYADCADRVLQQDRITCILTLLELTPEIKEIAQ